MASKKLTDLNPRFLGHGGPGVYRQLPDGSLEELPRSEGVGIEFDCPCGNPECVPCFVPFTAPLFGPGLPVDGSPRWERTGDTFETLTLAPSILRILPYTCGWHGWIRNGEVITC